MIALTDLADLASERLGGVAIAANDEFSAAVAAEEQRKITQLRLEKLLE
jgi:allantoicase